MVTITKVVFVLAMVKKKQKKKKLVLTVVKIFSYTSSLLNHLATEKKTNGVVIFFNNVTLQLNL